jgi:hypothetical protein
LADFDGDGVDDMITGCFEGGSYLLSGLKPRGFAKATPVLDKDGARLRVGQYWDYDTKKWTGVPTSEFKEFLGIAATPVDWDADGDFDLLLGTNQGRVFLRLNEGTRQAPAFATESIAVQAGGAAMALPNDHHAMPVVADWDGDGAWDLLSGSNTGAVWWWRNTGTDGAPASEAPRTLLGKSKDKDGPGQRTQVAVADWDGDGRPDLIVGDYRSARGADNKHTFQGNVWLVRRRGGEKAERIVR